jgi:hypothetical protein
MKEEASLGNPFIGELRGGRSAKDGDREAAHVVVAPSLCPKGVAVELKREIVEGKGGKEGEGVQPSTNLWATSHAWPPLNPYFHPPLAPIMLTPLTKSIESKENSFHRFPKFILFIYLFEIFRFYIMQ